MLKSYLKQDNVGPPHNIIIFELDFNVKLSLLRLLYFLIDLKSTIIFFHISDDLESIITFFKSFIVFINIKILKKKF